MISVIVKKDRNNEYVGFSCKGHAGYDDAGKDIVCAAVSVLVINTINSIEKLTESKFTVDEEQSSGKIDFSFTCSPSKEASLLIDAMCIGLDGISKQYKGSYVTLKIKEV